MNTAPGCPFCPANGLIANPVTRRRSAGGLEVLTFEPLAPVAPGHLLVVPATHVPNAAASPWVAAECMQLAAWLAAEHGGPANIITSIGAAATQTVHHLHLHLVPRRPDDGLHLPWTGQVSQRSPEPLAH